MSEPDLGNQLSRPPTRLEKAGAVFARVSGITGLVVLVLALVFLVVVGIPSISVARSPAYASARAAILSSPTVMRVLGDFEVSCEHVPRKYSFEGNKAHFEFEVFGDPTDHGRADTVYLAVTDVEKDTSGNWRVKDAALMIVPSKERKERPVRINLVREGVAVVGSGTR